MDTLRGNSIEYPLNQFDNGATELALNRGLPSSEYGDLTFDIDCLAFIVEYCFTFGHLRSKVRIKELSNRVGYL